jgi:hypothetical protein
MMLDVDGYPHPSIYICLSIVVIAVEPEGNRRDCNTMEKQRGRR